VIEDSVPEFPEWQLSFSLAQQRQRVQQVLGAPSGAAGKVPCFQATAHLKCLRSVRPGRTGDGLQQLLNRLQLQRLLPVTGPPPAQFSADC
jgi:hypothetical protein